MKLYKSLFLPVVGVALITQVLQAACGNPTSGTWGPWGGSTMSGNCTRTRTKDYCANYGGSTAGTYCITTGYTHHKETTDGPVGTNPNPCPTAGIAVVASDSGETLGGFGTCTYYNP